MPKKILLADDSITIQKVVELTFSDADYEVTAVNNGAKAIAKLAEMRPDIILSDIIMPEKNGYEVCEYVKSHPEFRNIPVVLLTGTFEPFDPDRAEKAGCDAVVTKPFESQSLIQKVEELISQSSNAAPAAPAPEPEAAPAPSPWTDDTEVVPIPEPSPFSTASGTYPVAGSDPFAHDADIFNAPPPVAATTEIPFETPAVDDFSPETRAFPKMSFEEMQQMAAAAEPPPPPPPPPPAPEPVAEASPWDEQQPELGGETRAFPRMTFDEMLAAEQQQAAPEPEPLPEPEPESESPFGAPPPAEEFSGETRAFPKMSFDDMQQMMGAEATPPPEPEPVPEPSPWDEQPEALGGETRAFPKMTFDEMLAAQPAPEASPWDEPAIPPAEYAPEPETEWAPPLETSAPLETIEELPVDETPFVAEPAAEAVVEESYAESYAEPLPEPEPEPLWEPAAEAEAPTEEEAEPLAAAAPDLAPESPSLPIAAARELTDEQVDRIARRVIELMSDHVVRNIAWEVIPDLAEMVVKERIRQLESEA